MNRFTRGYILIAILGAVVSSWGQETSPTTLLVQRLESSDLQERRDAAYELAELGGAAKDAVTALSRALQDRDTQVRAEATRALASLGPLAAPAISVLLERMDTDDNQRRYRSAHALGSIGVAALPDLRACLESDKARLRAGGACAIGWMGPAAGDAVGDLILRLDDGNEDVRFFASEALGRIGFPALEPLTSALSSERPHVQAGAAQALSAIGQHANSAAPTLMKLMKSDSTEVRGAAVAAVGNVMVEDGSTIQPLLAALRDESAAVHSAAVEACLKWSRETQQQAAIELAQMLRQGDETLGSRVALVLGGFGPRAAGAVPDMLAYLLRNPNSSAMELALGRIGEPAIGSIFQALREERCRTEQVLRIIEVMPAQVKIQLATSIHDESPQVREIATFTLGQLVPVPRTAAATLTQALADTSSNVRAAAVTSLTKIGAPAKSALTALVEVAENDSVADVRAVAVSALSHLQDDKKKLISTLTGRLADPAPLVQKSALAAMSAFDELPPHVQKPVAILLEHSDPGLRSAATEAIVRVTGKRAETAPLIVRALRDEDNQVRRQALESVAFLGEAAEAALPVIEAQLADESPDVRGAAVATLASIGRYAQPAFGHMSELIGDPVAAVRLAVVKGIRDISNDEDRILPLLIRSLEDEAWEVRRSAAAELGEMEEAAAPAVPALLTMLRADDDSDAARQALREINTAGEEAIPLLLEIVQDDAAGRRSRYYSLFILRQMGARAKSALPALEKLLSESEGGQRESLERAIREIKGDDA